MLPRGTVLGPDITVLYLVHVRGPTVIFAKIPTPCDKHNLPSGHFLQGSMYVTFRFPTYNSLGSKLSFTRKVLFRLIVTYSHDGYDFVFENTCSAYALAIFVMKPSYTQTQQCYTMLPHRGFIRLDIKMKAFKLGTTMPITNYLCFIH